MAWERRKGRRYYYRARKVGGRVVKKYLGSGKKAEIAAKLDELAVVQREQLRQACRATMEEFEELDRILAPLHELVDAVVAFVMTEDGYHLSRGAWRKKHRKSASSPPRTQIMAPIYPLPTRTRTRSVVVLS